ncbi:MAG: DUF1330 domain-containing protein [Gemmatimonadetes bacterium]|nr:DUF1330 domain-containing protein [Gemmatimonadota bacterium]
MAAYVIVDIDVTDPTGYEKYKGQAEATVTAYGGRYVVRGGQARVLEGDWQPARIVVLEFPTVERALEWWRSEEYREPKELRHATARSRMMVVQGV